MMWVKQVEKLFYFSKGENFQIKHVTNVFFGLVVHVSYESFIVRSNSM